MIIIIFIYLYICKNLQFTLKSDTSFVASQILLYDKLDFKWTRMNRVPSIQSE